MSQRSPLLLASDWVWLKDSMPRGGKAVAIYGAPPKTRIVINRFDSLDQAVAAYNSVAYKEAKAIAYKYATFRILAVEGLEQ
jgi:uncharacterized protein (DUF1330 family)